MRYFTLPSQVIGRALARRRNTTVHVLKLGRVAIVWDFRPDR